MRLAANDALRGHVEDRLAGRIARPDGTPLHGPRTVWRRRRHGPRQARRWARARSARSEHGQTSARLEIDFPEDEAMRISHEAICRSLSVQARGARCGASRPPAPHGGGRRGFPAPGPAEGASPSSRPGSGSAPAQRRPPTGPCRATGRAA